MARTTSLIPNQSEYTCIGCNESKPTSEFYVNRKRKNGLQAYCKSCCKEKNAEFRFKRPSYQWGDETTLGYLELNYERFKEILRKSNAADKTNKIYALPTPEGTYIGATSRHLHARKADHKWSYFGYRKGIRKTTIPALFAVLDTHSIEEVENIFNSMYIIEEWEGDRKELMKREGEIIREFISRGEVVLNVLKIKSNGKN